MGECGVEGQYLVSDKKGKLKFQTKNLMQTFSYDEELVLHVEAKWKNQKDKSSYLLDVKEISIPELIQVGRKAYIQFDTVESSKSHIESTVSFNGRQTYLRMNLNLPCQFQGEDYSLATEVELDLADSKNKAVFQLKVTNA